jgi:hypothetical protein
MKPSINFREIDPKSVKVEFGPNKCLVVPNVKFDGDRATNATLLSELGQFARAGQTPFDQIGTNGIEEKLAANTPQDEREAFALIEQLNREIVQRSLVMRRLITAVLIGS